MMGFDVNAYLASAQPVPGGELRMARREGEDVLLVSPPGLGDFAGECVEINGKSYRAARLTHESADMLRKLVPFTAPRPVLREARSFGLGDRLGFAGDGHLRAVEGYDAFPVLAQQSVRELTLTNRTFSDVLDAASFAVFRRGFTRGFGADGDHLKTPEEVATALRLGFTIITLDCSEHIKRADNPANAGCTVPIDLNIYSQYLNGDIPVGETRIAFTETSLRQCVAIYGAAIEFAARIYSEYIAERATSLDFEVSIDETAAPTTPEQHYFVASELTRRGVRPASVAPRFCGEFQKGVDYVGDLRQFERELIAHAAISEHFGYKLSIHSGSDKFSVFALIGKHTRGRFHVKTAGTSWLEAMRVVAERAPALYREVHAFALARFDEARRYYHVTTDLTKIPDLQSLSDAELPALFGQNDARQLIHITYGLILKARAPGGEFAFRDRLYALWARESELYAERLRAHIARHLSPLCGYE
jgi:hypothetical protein